MENPRRWPRNGETTNTVWLPGFVRWLLPFDHTTIDTRLTPDAARLRMTDFLTKAPDRNLLDKLRQWTGLVNMYPGAMHGDNFDVQNGYGRGLYWIAHGEITREQNGSRITLHWRMPGDRILGSLVWFLVGFALLTIFFGPDSKLPDMPSLIGALVLLIGFSLLGYAMSFAAFKLSVFEAKFKFVKLFEGSIVQ